MTEVAATTHRVTVDFSDEAYKALGEIAEKLGTSKAEALRRSLALMRYVTTEGDGQRLIIEDPKTGQRQQLVRY